MRLSPHFRSEEFRCRDGTPVPVHALPDLQDLCRRYLEPLRSQYLAVHVISGYRTRQHNAAVDGAPKSFHIYQQDRYGAAADIRCQLGGPADWYRALARMNPGGLGRYDDHVHVDNRRGHARW